MSTKSRKNELSLMSVIFCLFVIFIHAASYAVTYADKGSWQYAAIFPVWKLSSCAVPGFIFLAGIKLALGLEKPFSYPKYLAGRFFRVVLPYIIAAVVYALYFYFSGLAVYTPGEFIQSLVLGKFEAHFYFVTTIVQFYLLAPLWRILARRLDNGVRVAVTLVIAYFLSLIFGLYLADFLILFDREHVFVYADRVFTTYLFWWIGGLCVGRHYEVVKKEAARSFIPASVIFAFAAILDGTLAYLHTAKGAGIWWLETVHTLYILTAVIFFFSLGVKLSESRAMKLIKPLDRASYQIYLWHPFAFYFADRLSVAAGIASISGVFAARILFAVLVIALCVLLTGIKLPKKSEN